MANEITELFVQRLREALDKRGMSQTELSKRTGISTPNITYYLKGTYLPKMKKLNAMAKALSVNPLWLIGESADMEAFIPGKEETKKSILDLVNSMDQKDLEKTLSFIKEYIVK